MVNYTTDSWVCMKTEEEELAATIIITSTDDVIQPISYQDLRKSRWELSPFHPDE